MTNTGWKCDCAGCRFVRTAIVFMIGFIVGWTCTDAVRSVVVRQADQVEVPE